MTRGVVYKTIDGGKNWKAIWRGENLVRYVWINPRDTDVLYISTGILTGRPTIRILKTEFRGRRHT